VRTALLTEARFYLDEIDRRDDAFRSRRDFWLELAIISLIVIEIAFSWVALREGYDCVIAKFGEQNGRGSDSAQPFFVGCHGDQRNEEPPYLRLHGDEFGPHRKETLVRLDIRVPRTTKISMLDELLILFVLEENL
jgi:hypothetical protein